MNIQSGLGTIPTARPCAPLTIPSRVEIFAKTAAGITLV
jgi:hypothetical protein